MCMIQKTFARLPFLAIWIFPAAIFVTVCGRADPFRPLPDKLKTYQYETPPDGEMPWEVWSDEGEAYLTDLYYAEAAQNEQVIPTRVKLNRSLEPGGVDYQIDRLIYPTIGNPNLFFADDTDTLIVVLRLDQEWLRALGQTDEKADEKTEEKRPYLSRGKFSLADDSNEIRFYLIDRTARRLTEGDGLAAPTPRDRAFRIIPNELYVHSDESTPEVFRDRRSVRFLFDRGGVGNVRPGLYDLRYEFVRDGKIAGYEFQYNAVRVFPGGADAGSYFVLNMTDNQISVSTLPDANPLKKQTFSQITLDKLKNLIQYLNTSADPHVRGAAFLTYNGDLHNGGSPGTLLPDGVALSYRNESKSIVESLRELRLPIFLIPGNHDGYVSTGHVPGSIEQAQTRDSILHLLFGWLIDSLPDPYELDEVVADIRSREIWDAFEEYVDETDGIPGGWHLDLYYGRFIRRPTDTGGASGVSWKEVPAETRNQILYDGFHYWRRNYGPLYASWNFGDNHYVNMNSFDLRQHRRTGWGMYTVNYGGGVSEFQLHWLLRDLDRSVNRDAILLAHHDPRGGHTGVNYPYYFKQIDYTGMSESALNYVRGEVINPIICDTSLDNIQSVGLSCLHDGLQEWMRADQEFDCPSRYIFESGPLVGTCDRARLKKDGGNSVYSGYQLINELSSRKQIRTLLLGHTHYNSLEILGPGQALVPETVVLDKKTKKHLAILEEFSPTRDYSVTDDRAGIKKENNLFVLDLKQAGHDFRRVLDGHELAILRMTTTAILTTQQTVADKQLMDGFTVFEVFAKQDQRQVHLPQLNAVRYYQARPDGVANGPLYRPVLRVDLNRARAMERDDAANPLGKVFTPGK